MENWMNDYRVESDNKLTCKYCDKKVHKNWLARHVKSVGHRFQKSHHLVNHIQTEIRDSMMKRFNREHADLTGKEKEEKLFQTEKRTWELYNKAYDEGFLMNILEPDDFDCFHYEIYLRENFEN